MVAMVDGEAAAGIKVPLSLSVEYFRLPTLGDFVNGVNKYCEERDTQLQIHRFTVAGEDM